MAEAAEKRPARSPRGHEPGRPVEADGRETLHWQDGVRVFYATVPPLDARTIAGLAAALAPAERQRAARFAFEKDRQLFIAAHALARHASHRAGGRRPRCSLSHCAGLAACAVAADIALGLDVEAIQGRPDLMAVAEAYFGESERAYLDALPPAILAHEFTRLWTLKEAALKAAGTGLSRGLREFRFALDPLALTAAPPQADGATWQLEEFAPAPGFCASLALRRPPAAALAVSWHAVDIASLA